MKFQSALILSMFFLISASAPAVENTADSKEKFRSLIDALAESSQHEALSCRHYLLQTSGTGTEKPTVLSMSVREETGDGYPGAYFIDFQGPSTFSTLIAYEGLNHHIMGKLEVKSRGGTTSYKHTFDGFFDDITRVDIKDNRIVSFKYDKKNPQGVSFMTITCSKLDIQL